ncbi:hypothetical protein KI809_02170 [Geobacter pelophilus]|uniref:Uncharacterized protein n=1 Tax=Geoanaerobacter pelophilus TaxID=60036 RepID=A0AAW4KWL0_9BACT|nr:hypothetical protein [Geoanaerobacter pelophilus]
MHYTTFIGALATPSAGAPFCFFIKYEREFGGAEYQNLNPQYGNNTPGTSGTGTAKVARLASFYFF